MIWRVTCSARDSTSITGPTDKALETLKKAEAEFRVMGMNNLAPQDP